jgi:hypothetical protein
VGCRLDDLGSIPGRGDYRFHSSRHRVCTGFGPILPKYPMGTGTLYTDVKRAGRETDHLYLVPILRMHGYIPPFTQYIFMA